MPERKHKIIICVINDFSLSSISLPLCVYIKHTHTHTHMELSPCLSYTTDKCKQIACWLPDLDFAAQVFCKDHKTITGHKTALYIIDIKMLLPM